MCTFTPEKNGSIYVNLVSCNICILMNETHCACTLLFAVIQSLVNRSHTFQDESLIVSVYYDCLGVIPPGHDAGTPPASVPSYFDIDDVHPRVC